MLSNIVPELGAESTSAVPLNAEPLAWALERMTPELWASPRSESPAERQARQLAAADIFDDLLAEYAAELESDVHPLVMHPVMGGMPGAGKSCGLFVSSELEVAE